MNWLDLIIVVCAVIGLIKGLFDGMIKQVISLIALVLAILFSGAAAKSIKAYLIQTDFLSGHISEPIMTVICYLLAFLIIFWGLKFISKLIDGVVKATPLSLINILMGGLTGVFIYLVSMSLIFNLLTIFDYKSSIIKEQSKQESKFFYSVKGILPAISPMLKNYFFIVKPEEKTPEPQNVEKEKLRIPTTLT